MKRGVLPIAALLCALPARGADSTLSDAVVSVLTPVDSVPTSTALDHAFAPLAALDQLRLIARDETRDLAIQLRAIRALPAYCFAGPPGCGPAAPQVHDTLFALLERYTPAAGAVPAPQDVLRLQAAVEALGATRSQSDADVQKLLPLLAPQGVDPRVCGPGRDVRASAARAIGQLCSRGALDDLRPYQDDACGQVAVQVRRAMQALELCPA